ncbi:uncharacterized protein MKK02DRAFT_28626 [Dioszegia hungarica]|uniref:Uncharacterized protein n=1 Tax=Dioszegia hungarica TaxID=4972 RepID=A0AA38H485_9TREE|nr:uncharacterized protein MKK02DRAFT_28626 [Dioszegia hungarica]KAI9633876.1 hypothetical protein MKK02DRAFT_28626 [Dioszegia hungarica]
MVHHKAATSATRNEELQIWSTKAAQESAGETTTGPYLTFTSYEKIRLLSLPPADHHPINSLPRRQHFLKPTVEQNTPAQHIALHAHPPQTRSHYRSLLRASDDVVHQSDTELPALGRVRARNEDRVDDAPEHTLRLLCDRHRHRADDGTRWVGGDQREESTVSRVDLGCGREGVDVPVGLSEAGLEVWVAGGIGTGEDVGADPVKSRASGDADLLMEMDMLKMIEIFWRHDERRAGRRIVCLYAARRLTSLVTTCSIRPSRRPSTHVRASITSQV